LDNEHSNYIYKNEEEDFIENYRKEISSKKLTKQNLEIILLNFSKNLAISNERQKSLQMNYEQLEKKCEEYYTQNEELIHEITSRR